MNQPVQPMIPLVAAALLALPPQDPASEVAPRPAPLAGRVIERVATSHDPGQEYAAYFPSSYGIVGKKWPVLFVLDPRGRAVAGVERFLPAAERHGYVVMSSYQSRSDTSRQVTIDALDALLLDAQRLEFDARRLYLAGMSGTAHASWTFGQLLKDNVAGVIAAVGGVQTRTQGPPGDARFSYYGITATADFNYQEVMRLEEHLLSRGIDHRIEVFEGRHGWPPHEYTNRALDWMEFQAVKRGLAPMDGVLIDSELAKAREAAHAAADSLEQLRRQRDIVRDFRGLRTVGTHVEAAGLLESDPEVERRRLQEKTLAKAEGTYIQHLRRWLAEMENELRRPPTVRESLVSLRIDALQMRAAAVDAPWDAHSAQRTLENLYVNVAYRFPQEFEEAGDFERAIRSLEVAAEVLPDRAGTVWRLAEANAKAGRTEAALEALRRATAFGNVDLERLETDPTWESLRDSAEWAELIALVEQAPTPSSGG